MPKLKSNPARATRATAPAPKPSAKPRARAAQSASSLPDFIPFALSALVPAPPTAAEWVHEIKLDGWRTQLRIEDGTATIRTRNGHDYTSTFPEIARAARGLDNAIIDGEICFIGKNGIADFSELQAAMKGGRTDQLVYLAFDVLFSGDRDLRAKPLIERKRILGELIADTDQSKIRGLDHLDASGRDVLRIACQMGLEGIISKRLSDPYVAGRTGAWTKAKCRATQHAIVGGWTVSPKGFSGLLLGVMRGKELVPIGRVGTGFPR